MTKIQTILSLLLCLVIIFSMDMIFGNPLRETFRGGGGIGIGGLGLGVRPRILVTNDAPSYYFEQSDDEPLFFNWFKRF
jgi:galactitol-specific phosphotransferase system IIC component